jgi:hypothetical protein
LSDDESSFLALPPEAQAAAKAGREADKAAEAEAAAAKEGGRSSGRTSGRTTPNRASERASGDDLEDPKAPPPSSEDASAEVTQSGPNYAYVVSTYLIDIIQDFCSKLGMKLWINWISRNNLSLTITLVRSTNIIKDLFHFFCLIARNFLIQCHI